MAKLDDGQSEWGTGITRIEESDSVLGGPPEKNLVRYSPVNHALQEVVNRLNYLRSAIGDITIPTIVAATETLAGVARLATSALAQGTGISDKTDLSEYDHARIMTLRRTRQAMLYLMPEADTSQLGGVTRASDAEATARTDTSKYVTPAHLPETTASPPNASTSQRGIVERATSSEAVDLLDTERHLTASLVRQILEHINAASTASKRGTIEIANQGEGRGGTNNDRAMTSQRVLDQMRNGTGSSADTSRRGTVQRATSSEASARTNTTKYIVPAHLPGDASTTVKGLVEKATSSEATGLTDNERFLTSLLVKSILEHSNAQATTSKRGTVEIATETEAQDENNNTKVLTPGSLYRSGSHVLNISSFSLFGGSGNRINSVSGTVTGNYFGPIFYGDIISGTISIVIHLAASISGVQIQILGPDIINLTDFTWVGATNRITNVIPASNVLSATLTNPNTYGIAGHTYRNIGLDFR